MDLLDLRLVLTWQNHSPPLSSFKGTGSLLVDITLVNFKLITVVLILLTQMFEAVRFKCHT